MRRYLLGGWQHWTNDNDWPGTNDSTGRPPTHGRWWFHFPRALERCRTTGGVHPGEVPLQAHEVLLQRLLKPLGAFEAHAEWLLKPALRLGASLGLRGASSMSDPGVGGSVQTPLGSFYWGVKNQALGRLVDLLVARDGLTERRPDGRLKLNDGRRVEFYVTFDQDHRGGFAHWRFWADESGWSNRVPRWRDGGVFIDDVLLGRATRTEQLLEKRTVKVAFPEKTYDVVVEMKAARWTRPRWPWPKQLVLADMKVVDKGGIPHPGKGENSWDCGQDATFGMSCPARNVADAVGKLVASVLRDRIRYGGHDWAPEPPEGSGPPPGAPLEGEHSGGCAAAPGVN